jgi:ribosomal protein S18 acetylase RimI-like enzyme
MNRDHVTGFHSVLDLVAKEGRYLAFLEAPPVSRVRRFVRSNLLERAPQFVATSGGRVVGWCDITIRPHPTVRHSGTLGMGVLASHRGKGIGRRLLEASLEAAELRELTRIELIVRADNQPAIGLYLSCGFDTEGRMRHYMIVNGDPHDALLMARLSPAIMDSRH